MSVASLPADNEKRWATAQMQKASNFVATAKRLVGAKSRYMAMSAKTGVPWFVIAVIHEREASQSWSANIANGQLFDRKTTIVPIGRGPFKSWEDAAYDALVRCAPYAARNSDWSAGATLALLEKYNGLGYAMKGVPSPYIWAGTTAYRSGKYVRDHVYDPNYVDTQLGCAGIIKAMMALDPTISFGLSNAPVRVANDNTIAPTITNPAKGSIGAWFASFLKKAA